MGRPRNRAQATIVPIRFCLLNHWHMNCMDRLPAHSCSAVSWVTDGLLRGRPGNIAQLTDLPADHPLSRPRCRLRSASVTNCQFRSVCAARISNIKHNISLGDIMELRTNRGVESVHILFCRRTAHPAPTIFRRATGLVTQFPHRYTRANFHKVPARAHAPPAAS